MIEPYSKILFVSWSLMSFLGCNIPNLDVPPELILGTGDTKFEALLTDEENDLGIQYGVQGGQHVWGAVRVIGIDWRELELSFALVDEGDFNVTTPSTTISRLKACPPSSDGCEKGMGEQVGFTIVLDDPNAAAGLSLELRGEASDDEGRSASANVPITVHF